LRNRVRRRSYSIAENASPNSPSWHATQAADDFTIAFSVDVIGLSALWHFVQQAMSAAAVSFAASAPERHATGISRAASNVKSRFS
jgi:hypothetical protein